ncbi:kinase-like domain-containing protein [Obelidium mucronatum]|nr:kinase-like domain-containing protein [Obelidium mucronatum]
MNNLNIMKLKKQLINNNMFYSSKEDRRIPVTIIKYINAGGNGFLFEGRSQKPAGWEGVFDEADMAVKVQMKKSDPSGHYFYKEVAVMSKLGNHENIVEFYGYGDRTRLHFFIMMELCDTDLLQILKDRSLDVVELKEGVHQIGAGVSFLHHEGICHNDIKASNVLLKIVQGTVRYLLCDFGVSCSEETQMMDSGSITYRAPECFLAHWVGQDDVIPSYNAIKSDIWALGVLVAEMAGINLWTSAEMSDPEFLAYYSSPQSIQAIHKMSLEFYTAVQGTLTAVTVRSSLEEFRTGNSRNYIDSCD